MHTATSDEVDGILSDLVRSIGSDLPSDLVLRLAVDALRRMEPCLAAHVYLFDATSGDLVLRASAPAGQHVGGEDTYRLGEGVVGRAALMPEGHSTGSVVAARSPRAAAGPAAATHAPMVATRIATASGDLLGVCALVRAAGSDPVRHLSLVAGLAGIALERSRAAAATLRLSELAGSIDILGRCVTGGSPLAETLDAIAALALRASGACACAIYVSERSDADFHVAATAPRGTAVPDVLRAASSGRSGAPAPAASTPGGDALVAAVVRPVTTGTERVATVILFDAPAHKPSDDEIRMCERLAQMVAIAIRQRRLIDSSTERMRPDELLWEIVGSGHADPAAILSRAHRMGCDLGEAHVVVVGSAPAGERPARLRSAILAADPGAVADLGGDRVVAIVSVDALARLPAGPWSIGVSQPCRELTRYPAAYRQARETLELGARLFGEGRVVRSDDLGSYRFVPALVESGLRAETEYVQVSRLSDELLRTLEAYLDSGGNTALAAKQLFLHRNTLRQRLERISQALQIDVSVPQRWLALQLAIKTARMSRLEGASTRPTM